MLSEMLPVWNYYPQKSEFGFSYIRAREGRSKCAKVQTACAFAQSEWVLAINTVSFLELPATTPTRLNELGLIRVFSGTLCVPQKKNKKKKTLLPGTHYKGSLDTQYLDRRKHIAGMHVHRWDLLLKNTCNTKPLLQHNPNGHHI